MIKKATLLLTGLIISIFVYAQEIDAPLPYFNKIQVSSHVSVVLSKGDNEHLRLEYSGVDVDKINYRVKGKTLEIFLDGARVSDKTKKIWHDGMKQNVSYYQGAKITAYITYKDLNGLEIRGEEEVVVEDPINAKKFNIRQYGETNIKIADLNAEKLKVKLYGENHLQINAGAVAKQKFTLYGENRINTENLKGSKVAVNSFGENKLNVKAEDQMRIFGLGEMEVVQSGKSPLRKLMIGESRIRMSE